MDDNQYFEVQWLDKDGVGHTITFNLDQEETMKEFLQTIAPICCMADAYKMTRMHL